MPIRSASLFLLFTRMCGNARSGVQPDPILLIAFWRDKTQKLLSFLRLLGTIRPFESYRFFKGNEQFTSRVINAN